MTASPISRERMSKSAQARWANTHPDRAVVRAKIIQAEGYLDHVCDRCGDDKPYLFVTDYESVPPTFLWRCRRCADQARAEHLLAKATA